MAIVWGPDCQLLYNDAYREILQDRHPSALGAAGRAIFPELWEYIRPLIERAYRGESVVWTKSRFHWLGRAAPRRCISPAPTTAARRDGNVHGFLAIVVDTTKRVTREQARARVFDTILSSITDFAYSFDHEGRLFT